MKRVVDLFAGAGGISVGFTKAGFNVVAANEYNPVAAKTYAYNHPETCLIVRDIYELKAEDVYQNTKLSEGKTDVLVGGPPCQGFSMAGKRNANDPRNTLFRQYLRLVSELQPKWVVMENVPGLLSMQGGKVVDEIITSFHDLGYAITPRVLNSADFGVPQIRHRVFFLGNRVGKQISFPNATHMNNTKYLRIFPEDVNPYVTVGEAISDLKYLGIGEGEEEIDYSNNYETNYQRKMRHGAKKLYNHVSSNHNENIQKRFSTVKKGGGMKSVPEKLRTKKTVLYRFDDKLPSRTITTLPDDYIHYSLNRIPTVREMARIQSFPDSFRFLGHRTTGGDRRKLDCPQYTQVGNAVPPLLAQALAEHLIKIM